MDGLKLLYPVMDKEYLSSPVEFIVDNLADLVVVEEHDLGLDGDSVRRRRADDREISRSEEGELKGSWNRCSRKGKSIDRLLELTELLLCAYTELLLLVNDKKSQILELESLSYELVGTYDDVQSTCLESLLNI